VPKTILTDAQVVINGTDLSDHCSHVEVDSDADEVDVTGFTANAYRELAQGLKDGSIVTAFYTDYDAGSVHQTLLTVRQASIPALVAVSPKASLPASTTNPMFVMSANLISYKPLQGDVGDALTTDATLRNANVDGIVELTGALFSSALSSGGQDVATTSTFVVAANVSRSLLILTNASDTVVYVTLGGGAAVLGQGSPLAANGGRVEIETTLEARAIHGATGTKRIGVVEL